MKKVAVLIGVVILSYVIVASLRSAKAPTARVTDEYVLLSNDYCSLSHRVHEVQKYTPFHLVTPVKNLIYTVRVYSGGWGPSVREINIAILLEPAHINTWLHSEEYADFSDVTLNIAEYVHYFAPKKIPWQCTSQPRELFNEQQRIVLFERDGIMLFHIIH